MLRHSITAFVGLTLLSPCPALAEQDYSFVDIMVSSVAAGAEGVAVRIAAPATPRFPEGAPIVIWVPGGGGTDAFEIRDYTGDHWAWRDVRQNLASLVAGHPTLAVMLHATTTDHVQSSADHAHVALVYATLTIDGARWVRLNPDAAYTASVASGLPDNDANVPLAGDITASLVPEALSNDTKIAHAGLYELTDRTRFVRWDANLSSTEGV